MDRDIIYTNSKVDIKVYHYIDEETFNIETFFVDDVLQVMTEKNMSNPSGTFSFKIAASKNWKKKIRPGDWLTISFSNKGRSRVKMLGNVDRVSRTKEVSESGTLVTRYMVYGRDFGKVFEKTNIYFNPYFSRDIFANNVLLKDGIIFTGSPDDVIKTLLSVFLGAGTKEIDELQQWYIPDTLKRDVLKNQTVESSKSGGSSFFDLLDQSGIEDTIGYKAYKSVSNLQGFLWNILKQNSHASINEMFLELKHDSSNNIQRPSLILRPLPFTREDFNLPKNVGNITLFKDLERVQVTDKEMFFEDLGESDHVRFNFIFMTSANTDYFNRNTFADWTSGEVPVINQTSIQKNGLLMRTDVSEFANIADGIKEKFDPNLLKNLNLLLSHWFSDAHKLESGTVKLVGNLDIELGKALEINYTKTNEKYLYYIEGYSNNWEYPGMWTTTVKLTRGYKLDGSGLKTIEDSNSEDKIYTGITKFDRE